MFSIFSNIKNVIMLLLGVFGVGYIAVQKYKAASATDKLNNIQKKIAKTNVIIAKKEAIAKAQGLKAETESHIAVLKDLNKQSDDIKKQMT